MEERIKREEEEIENDLLLNEEFLRLAGAYNAFRPEADLINELANPDNRPFDIDVMNFM